MIFSRSGGYQGVAFSIPDRRRDGCRRQLRDDGKVRRGRIGVSIGRSTRTRPRHSGSRGPGRAGQRSRQGQPAEKAGVEPGDIILKFDGKRREVERPAADRHADQAGHRVDDPGLAQGRDKDMSVVVEEMKEDDAPKADRAAATRQGQGAGDKANRLGWSSHR
jgi:serine protease Do